MQYVHLGRSGLRVSRLCLGTMNFGPRTEEPQAFAIMDRAHEQGLNFFDTANVYGRSSQDQSGGRTEEIVGRWFAQGGGRRERTVLATKVYGNMGTTWPNEDRLSALNIRRAGRCLVAPAADRLHRPLPDAPCRPGHPLGGDLGGHGGAPPPGQGPLLRLVQLRRLAHRQGSGSGGAPQVSWAWCPSSPSTTCSCGRSRWRCSPPPSTTASASSPGHRSRAACSGASSANPAARPAVPGQ